MIRWLLPLQKARIQQVPNMLNAGFLLRSWLNTTLRIVSFAYSTVFSTTFFSGGLANRAAAIPSAGNSIIPHSTSS